MTLLLATPTPPYRDTCVFSFIRVPISAHKLKVSMSPFVLPYNQKRKVQIAELHQIRQEIANAMTLLHILVSPPYLLSAEQSLPVSFYTDGQACSFSEVLKPHYLSLRFRIARVNLSHTTCHLSICLNISPA